MSSRVLEALGGRVPLTGTRLGYAVLATVGIGVAVVTVLVTGLIRIPPNTAERAIAYLRQYGLLALFGLFVLEGAMLLVFAPSESLVPAGVLLLADSTVDIAVIIAVAVAGATLGQLLLFLLAKRGGREVILDRGWINVGDERLARFEAWFERWGVVAVPVSNTSLFIRGMLTVPAGLAEMDTRTFVVLSALGTLSFEVILATIAVYASDVLTSILPSTL